MGKRTNNNAEANIISGKIPVGSFWTKGSVMALIGAVLIMVIGSLIYSNIFSVPFLFDDTNTVLKNISLRETGYFTNASPAALLKAPRLIGQLSFALNYAVGGLNVFGYHLVNLLIHLASALLVYGLCLLTFRTPYFTQCFPVSADWPPAVKIMALFAALLFVCHPIQTQAITYIVQRYAALCTFFYLFSLVLYLSLIHI